MPYLLMVKSYDYDDQYYYEEEGGFPELVFGDEQHLEALGTLNAHRQAEWLGCTPLDLYYQDHTLADLSSSDLDEHALARGIAGVLGQSISAKDLLETDFQTLKLSTEQEHLIGLMLDGVGHSYLEFVQAYGGD